MFPDRVSSTSYALGQSEREISTGILNFLSVIVTGLTSANAGTEDDVEAAARLILQGMTLNVTRRTNDGSTVEIIEDLPADFFRRRSNHFGGYSSPLDGALILLGLHNLNTPKSSLVVEADWSGVDVTTITDGGGLEAVDTSGAEVLILRSQSFEAMPFRSGQVPQYKGVQVLKNPYEVPQELDGSTREMFYVGDFADYTKSRLDVNGEKKDVVGEFSNLISASRYRHENEDERPLLQLFDADAGYAQRIAAELTIYAEGGQVALVGVTQL